MKLCAGWYVTFEVRALFGLLEMFGTGGPNVIRRRLDLKV